MASLRGRTLLNLAEIRDCGSARGGGGCGRRQRRDGFVSYTRNDDDCQRRRMFSRVPRLAVVNSSRTDWASGASSSSVFDRDRDQGSSSKLGSLATYMDGNYERQRRDEDNHIVDVAGKLDLWVKESVVEILNNIEEAPFLVHIYSDGKEGSESGSEKVREKASTEKWPKIKGRWNGGEAMPSGIILVEEMKNKEGEDSGRAVSDSCSSTKVWGILIQGKGLSCPACYLLKTCRIRSVLGCSTHFCLSRVDCFFESADMQLKKFWLV